MSTVEIKKLVGIIDYDLFIPEASDPKYKELVADRRAANDLIGSTMEECVALQYL